MKKHPKFSTNDLLKASLKQLLKKTFELTIVVGHLIATLSKKNLKHACVPVEITKCFRAPFL